MGRQSDFTKETPSILLRDEFPPPSMAEWRAAVERELNGAPVEALNWRTPDGLSFAPLYTRESVRNLPHLDKPASAAPTSGWTVVEDSALAAPERVNAALLEGLARGATRVRIRLDFAASGCFNRISPDVGPSFGRGGCAVASIADLRIALQGVDFAAHEIEIECGVVGGAALSAVVALAQERGCRLSALRGAVGGDPFATLLRAGRLPGKLTAFSDELAARVAWCAAELPQLKPAAVDGEVYHEAGASAVEEIACALASGSEQLRSLVDRGVSPNSAASAILFRFRAAANIPIEVAKLRAVRLLWAKVVKAFGGAADAQRMSLACSTSRRGLTSLDLHCNLVRNALAAFAAVAGGCDSLAVGPYDEAIGESTAASRRLARNQQLLLRDECGLGRAADPFAGASAVEAITDSLAREAWARLQRIETTGGLSQAILSGEIQRRIKDAAGERLKALESGRAVIIGATKYAGVDGSPSQPLNAKRPAEPSSSMGRPKPEPRLDLETRLSEVRESRGPQRYEAAIRAAGAGAEFSAVSSAFGLVDRAESVKTEALPLQRDAATFEVETEGATF